MSNFNPYSNYGYAALIAESSAGVPLTPSTYFRIIGEALKPSFNIQPINEVAGDRERNIRSIPGQVEMEGEIEFFVEPKIIGHFLRSLFGAPTTQVLTAATAFRHVFEVSDTPKTYTIDINPGDAPWVHRFYGVQANKLAFTREDNAIKCTAGVMPRKAFISARVTQGAGSGTTLYVDQTSGLTTSDTILVLQHEDGFTTVATLTIAAVVSETELTVSTIGTTIDATDLVVIKRATITEANYSQRDVLTFLGGTGIYTGTDIDNTSEECKEDLEIEINNEVEARWCSGLEEEARYPEDILTKGYSASGKVTKFYDRESNLDRLRKNEKFGMRVLMQGETAIEANVAAKARGYWGTGNGFYVEADTAGKAGNDLNVTITINTIDTLAASKSGNNILVKLANTTASKNTGTLIAAAIDALSGVASVAEGTGAQQFTAAVANANLGYTQAVGTTAPVVGRDASEKCYLELNFAAAAIDPYFVNDKEDELVIEEMPLTFYKDSDSSDPQRKGWSTRLFLVNDVASY